MSDEKSISIVKDGPYLVKGAIPLDEKIMVSKGHHREYQQGQVFDTQESYALCRCGHSKNPPYCDGTHVAAGFDGTETADTTAFDDRVDLFRGPTLDLYDDNRCAFARFCHREDGEVWTLTEESGEPRLRDEAILASTECPAGRLVHHDKLDDYKEIEPELEPAISVLQDPERKVSAPLYVQGGIPLISAEGFTYEQRNRYALCRCGASRNKPFCDASHVNVGYKDGLE
ncbi:MAG: CDGSH iron-sulfur domain-containing protein [Coriobacteriales bacterium]|jgi:CDGSH-type Zn-finger protein|nr:CDGSH iron-sulfur domain-containing protein [Coriobacteriales bacterium]